MSQPAENKKLSAIEKALEIMLRFQDVNKASWGIRELSAELDFSPATVQRILTVLKGYGFVRQDPRTRPRPFPGPWASPSPIITPYPNKCNF